MSKTETIVKSLKLYLAASWTRRSELKIYCRTLEDRGYEVTSRWLWENTTQRGEGAGNALKDEEDVKRCDVLVAFTDEVPLGRGGRHVEFGMARALDKELVVVGPKEHIFHYLPGVLVYSGWETFRGDWCA